MKGNDAKEGSERRTFLRLDTVFPIEFQLIDKDDRGAISELKEGFTRNIGKGGIGIFAKTLKEHDKAFFDFKPGETKLKLNINVPLDKEPIEGYATVEWIEREPGALIDTYLFGVSYDFINEIEYDRIMSYVKWLRLKPKLIFLSLILLTAALVASATFLVKESSRRIESEKLLRISVDEGKLAKSAREHAENKVKGIEETLDTLNKKQMAIQSAFVKLAEEKKALEKVSQMSEETRMDLEDQVEELARERELLEEQIEFDESEAMEEYEGEIEVPGDGPKKISEERLMAEEANYAKFRELILNEKVQSLSAYVSTHRSSIYHAAALFALAELRFNYGERSLAEVNYNQIIEFYPRSNYALYSSHRLDQLRSNRAYEYKSLQDIYNDYNLPELSDYRDITPYIK
ncbi:MAG: hypothetical protein ISS26_00405 [Candidatus Omnitrophica bacterium]|nr:hypothetical protein [Candidatus Omnitrophota bacterium]